jgi:cytochrome P450
LLTHHQFPFPALAVLVLPQHVISQGWLPWLQVAPKPNTFMPFGNGTHSCPGNELAKLEMLVLFHHLATKYRWSTSESESGVQFGPFALPLNGLPMTFTRKQQD